MEEKRVGEALREIKERTRRAIKLLERIGGKVDDLKEEFLRAYGEEV